MSNKKVPEIARISPYRDNDVIQIFGENFDKNTKLYLWYNDEGSLGTDILVDHLFTDDMASAKADIFKKHGADCSKLGFEEENLPLTPPEQALVFDADDVCGKVIYFGEKDGPNPDANGRIIRAKSSTAVAWLKNEAGFSKPYIANRPEIWNQSVKETVPGGNIDVYGGNLGEVVHFSDGTNLPKLGVIKSCETGEVKPLIGLMTTAYLFDAHKYYAQFRVPEDIKPGEYEIYIHSGQCGIFGWSKPSKLTIIPKYDLNAYFRSRWNRAAVESMEMPEAKVKTISADPANPFLDYADAIQSAVDEMHKAGGGIVYLTAGTFPISHEIIVRDNVILMGSGKGTLIKTTTNKNFFCTWDGVLFSTAVDKRRGWANDYRPAFVEHGMNFMIRMCSDSGLQDLSIQMGNGGNTAVLIANRESQCANNVFINSVDIDNLGLLEYELSGMSCATSVGILCGSRTDELTIFSCNVTGLVPIRILPSRHTFAKIINNNFHCRPRQFDETAFAGLRHSVVTNNLFEGGRRAFVSNEGLSNNWIFQNRSFDGDRATCALENFMSEHGMGEWTGYAKEVGKDFIQIDTEMDIMCFTPGIPYNDRFDKYDRYLFIIDGRGLGQYKRIIRVEETGTVKKILLEENWEVLPDDTTVFAIVYATHHNLFVDNTVALGSGHSQFIWGAGFENVIAGHHMDLAAGIWLHSTHMETSPYAALKGTTSILVGVNAFNTIIRSRTRSSGMGIKIESISRGEKDKKELTEPKWAMFRGTRGVFGNCIKDCAFDGTEGLLYVKNLYSEDEEFPTCILLDGAYNRVVNNHIRGYKTPITLCNDCVGNCFARNHFSGEEQRFVGRGKACGIDAK